MAMASLSPGALLKLLLPAESPTSPSSSDDADHDPMVLQVVSIIPVFVDTGFVADRGFYLKVSDSSHTVVVSLPRDLDDLVLSNKLQLGQFIQVQRVELASPVPLLHGLQPIPGCHACIGEPIDLNHDSELVAPNDLADLATSRNQIPPLPENRKKHRSLSPSRKEGRRVQARFRSIPTSPVNAALKRSEMERKSREVLMGLAKISVACVDEDSDDSDCSRSTISSRSSSYSNRHVPWPKMVRRSWDITGRSRERRREINPLSRNRSSDFESLNKISATGISMPKGYESDHIPKQKRCFEKESIAFLRSGMQKDSVSKKDSMQSSHGVIHINSPSDTGKEEDGVAVFTLPANLVRIGKEVLRHRDLAMITAMEALQEASASEKLLRCLADYSELQTHEEERTQILIDKFLFFHEDLRQARLINQSLAKLSSLRTYTDSVGSDSIKEAAKATIDKRRHAASWIKVAMESDLSPEPITVSSEDSTKVEKPLSSIPGCHSNNVHSRTNGETWLKGKAAFVAADFGNALQAECNYWFLSYMERTLDLMQGETIYSASESQTAGFLSQIKKLDGWLDALTSKRRALPREIDACTRVRKKIYDFLLKQAEQSVNASENARVSEEESTINQLKLSSDSQ